MFVKNTSIILLLSGLCLANPAEPNNAGNPIIEGMECFGKFMTTLLQCIDPHTTINDKTPLTKEGCCVIYKSFPCVKEKIAQDATCKASLGNSLTAQEKVFQEGGECAKYHCSAAGHMSVSCFLTFFSLICAYLFLKY